MTRRGFTLVEMMVALAVSLIVLGAAYQLLRNNQRFYRSQSQITDVQQNVRAVAQIIPGELREISATGSDILAMSGTDLTIRAARAFGIICSVTDSASGRVVVRPWWGYRAPDPARDGMFVFQDRDTTLASDDRWLIASLRSIASGTCADGTSGTQVQLDTLQGGFGSLSEVTVGSPGRTFEQVTYRLYQQGTQWWLGVSTLVSGTWTTMSPVAGPLRATDGIAFDYFDAAGAVTADSSLVAMVVITVRGESSQPIAMQGRPAGTYMDSMVVRATLRGN